MQTEASTIKHGGEAVFQKGSDYLVLVLLIPLICIARVFCERVAAHIFLSTDAAVELARKKGRLKLAVKKFEESFWKCVYYSCSALYGFLFISWEPFVRNVFEYYPNAIHGKVYWFYMVSISFYIWMTVCLIWDVRKKDFYQMTAHHCITLTLMIFSYTCSLSHVGCLILLLHDIADPFLEMAKMCVYTKNENGANIFFALFALFFIGMRLGLYPYLAVYPCLTETWGLAVDLNHEGLWYLFNCCLLGLLALDAFWSFLIIKVCIKNMTSGSLKDSRSDNESE